MILLVAVAVGGAFFLSGRLMERNWWPSVRPAPSGRRDHTAAPPAVAVHRTTQRRQAVTALAGREGRRLLVHPVMLAAILLGAWGSVESVDDDLPVDLYNSLSGQFHILLTVGVLGALVVHLVGSAPRQADLEEQWASMPVDDLTRTAALLLGCLLPAAAAGAIGAASWGYVVATDIVLPRQVSGWAIAAAPLTVLGGLLLGVLLARWLPWAGAGAPALFLVVLALFGLSETGQGREYLAPYIERAVYNKIGVYRTGSEAWHVAYIGGLCLMAAIGALLRSPGRHLRLLLSAGAVAVLGTAYAGWAQL